MRRKFSASKISQLAVTQKGVLHKDNPNNYKRTRRQTTSKTNKQRYRLSEPTDSLNPLQRPLTHRETLFLRTVDKLKGNIHKKRCRQLA